VKDAPRAAADLLLGRLHRRDERPRVLRVGGPEVQCGLEGLPRRAGRFRGTELTDGVLGALAEIYGLPVETEQIATSLSDYFLEQLGRAPHQGDMVRLGEVVLQAHTISEGRLLTVGLQLEEPETPNATNVFARIKAALMWWRK